MFRTILDYIFLNWFGFIKKDRIEPLLKKAIAKTELRMNEQWESKLAYELEKEQDQRNFDAQEFRAEIAQLSSTIDSLKQREKDVEKVYYRCMRGATVNHRVAVNMRNEVKSATEIIAQVLGKFQNVVDQSEEHKLTVLSQDVENRQILKIAQDSQKLKKP